MHQSNLSGTLSNDFHIGKKLWFTNHPHDNNPIGTIAKTPDGLQVKNIDWQNVHPTVFSKKIYVEQNFTSATLFNIIRSQDHWFSQRLNQNTNNIVIKITQLDNKVWDNLIFDDIDQMDQWINANVVAPYYIQYRETQFGHLQLTKHYGVNKLYSMLKGGGNYLKPQRTIIQSTTIQVDFVTQFLNYYFNINNSSYLPQCFNFTKCLYSIYKLLHIGQIISPYNGTSTQDGINYHNNPNSYVVESSHIAQYLGDGYNLNFSTLKSSTFRHRRNQINYPDYSAVAVYVLAHPIDPTIKAFYIKPLGVDQMYVNYFDDNYVLESVENNNYRSKTNFHQAQPIRQDLSGDRQHYRIHDLINWSTGLKRTIRCASLPYMPEWNFRIKHLNSAQISPIGNCNLTYCTRGQYNPGSFYVR